MIRLSGIRSIIKWCYILLFAYLFMATQSLFEIPTLVSDGFLICFVVISTVYDQWKFRIRLDQYTSFACKHFFLPVILIFFYSIFMHYIYGLPADYYKHTLTRCVRLLAYYLVGMQSIRVLEQKTTDYLLTAAVIAYIPALIKYFVSYGFVNGISMLVMPETYHRNIELEVHTLTYIFGFFAIYYFSMYVIKKEQNAKWGLGISLILTLAGVKRIVILAVAVAIFAMVFLNSLGRRKRNRLIKLAAILLVAVPFIYLYFIHSGLLEKILNYFGINSSFRFNFWDYFRDRYSINPLFTGYGLSYSARTMDREWRYIALLGASTNIHNDVLQLYLGVGFIGSVLYWYNYFFSILRTAGKISTNAIMDYFVVSVYFFIIAMTSNEGLNPITMGIFFQISYVFVLYEGKKETGK